MIDGVAVIKDFTFTLMTDEVNHYGDQLDDKKDDLWLQNWAKMKETVVVQHVKTLCFHRIHLNDIGTLDAFRGLLKLELHQVPCGGGPVAFRAIKNLPTLETLIVQLVDVHPEYGWYSSSRYKSQNQIPIVQTCTIEHDSLHTLHFESQTINFVINTPLIRFLSLRVGPDCIISSDVTMEQLASLQLSGSNVPQFVSSHVIENLLQIVYKEFSFHSTPDSLSHFQSKKVKRVVFDSCSLFGGKTIYSDSVTNVEFTGLFDTSEVILSTKFLRKDVCVSTLANHTYRWRNPNSPYGILTRVVDLRVKLNVKLNRLCKCYPNWSGIPLLNSSDVMDPFSMSNALVAHFSLESVILTFGRLLKVHQISYWL
jgi:hypothetical protein